MSKLILGTAQFGMDYGINNKRGKIPDAEGGQILKRAMSAGIDTLDTAYAYNDSERRIGDFIRSEDASFRVISKLTKCFSGEVRGMVEESLKRLGQPSIYGYLVHNFDHYKSDKNIWEELRGLKDEGKIGKIGLSFYSPLDLEEAFKDRIDMDIAQIPFNIFDRRFVPYIQEMKKGKIEVHARSIFLQGIVFKKAEELDPYFAGMADKIRKLGELAVRFNISRVSLCLKFVMANNLIDGLVVGVDSISNLDEIIEAFKTVPLASVIIKETDQLSIDDERLTVPSNWKL